MKKLPLYLFVFIILLAIIVGAYFGALYFYGGKTATVLKYYELTRNADIVRTQLLEYEGEGPGTEKRIIFLEWGLRHPEDFIIIVDGVALSERSLFCEILGFTVTDSGLDARFETAFGNYDSECIRIIRTQILKHRSYRPR